MIEMRLQLLLVTGIAWCTTPSLIARAGPPTQEDGEAEASITHAFDLRLRDGSLHWGAIREHNLDHLVFERLDTGGLVRVPWGMLDAAQEKALRSEFGYVQVLSEELRIEVDLLQLDGGEEVVGKILDRQGDRFLIQTGGTLQAIPKARVVAVQGGVSVPALDVYSREQLYADNLARIDPTNAADQVALAELCEQILDFSHALEHYESARGLDSDYLPEVLPQRIETARASAALQEQIDYLREVEGLRKKGRYDEAVEKARAFESVFASSPMLERARNLLVQVENVRSEAVVDFVRKRWATRLIKLSRSQAGQTTFASATAYAQEGLGQDLRQSVLADARRAISPSLELSHVEEAFRLRRKGRYASASYGEGTWLLGPDGAVKGAEGEAQEVALSETDAEREKLAQKIRRFVESQEAARRAKNRAQQEEDFEAFWAGFSLGGRAAWIRAYYAEFGGDYELRPRPYLPDCRACGGTGVREVVYIGGGAQGSGGSHLQRCPLCQGVGVVRKVYYR
jgi:hypothetical protein